MSTHDYDACETCKFWIKISEENQTGYCIRYAPHPAIDVGISISKPVTKCYETCGDYIKRHDIIRGRGKI